MENIINKFCVGNKVNLQSHVRRYINATEVVESIKHLNSRVIFVACKNVMRVSIQSFSKACIGQMGRKCHFRWLTATFLSIFQRISKSMNCDCQSMTQKLRNFNKKRGTFSEICINRFIDLNIEIPWRHFDNLLKLLLLWCCFD